MGEPEPIKTYSTSEHLFTDLSIPPGVTGTLPRELRGARAGTASAEVEEDLGETGKTRSKGGGSPSPQPLTKQEVRRRRDLPQRRRRPGDRDGEGPPTTARPAWPSPRPRRRATQPRRPRAGSRGGRRNPARPPPPPLNCQRGRGARPSRPHAAASPRSTPCRRPVPASWGTALLVPGYTGSKEDFIAILGQLAAAGRRVQNRPARPVPDGLPRPPGRRSPGGTRSRRHRGGRCDGGVAPARALLRRPGGAHGRPRRLQALPR